MSSRSDPGYDFDRYRRLLAEATDEPKRIALIELLVVEKARAKLAAHRMAANEFRARNAARQIVDRR